MVSNVIIVLHNKEVVILKNLVQLRTSLFVIKLYNKHSLQYEYLYTEGVTILPYSGQGLHLSKRCQCEIIKSLYSEPIGGKPPKKIYKLCLWPERFYYLFSVKEARPQRCLFMTVTDTKDVSDTRLDGWLVPWLHKQPFVYITCFMSLYTYYCKSLWYGYNQMLSKVHIYMYCNAIQSEMKIRCVYRRIIKLQIITCILWYCY